MADYSQAQLEAMSLKDLQRAFETATGKPTKAPNKKYLIKTILDVQKDDSAEPDVDQQYEEYEAKLAEAKAAEASDAEAAGATTPKAASPGATTEATPESAKPYVSPFEGMTPKQIIEAAKAKGKAQVQQAKAEDATATDASDADPSPTKSKRRKGTDKATKDAPMKDSDGLADMDVTALQALYLKEIGRATGSTNTGYLIWKIREARKGNIKLGPAKERAPKSDRPVKVIPIRIEEDALAAMDALIGEGKAYTSRMDIFRKAIATWAEREGHSELYTILDGAWGR